MPDKLILDACCGGKQFWFNKHHPNTVYVDCRKLDRFPIWQNKEGTEVIEFEVQPDVVADFRNLPFPDESFWHVVFDPPHLWSVGETSWLAQKYGRLEEDWRDMIGRGFHECMRVLKPYGTLIFKWSDKDIKVKEILDVIGAQPFYGHRSGKSRQTHWMAFMKIPEERGNDDVKL